jgi:hypothetical protein
MGRVKASVAKLRMITAPKKEITKKALTAVPRTILRSQQTPRYQTG